GAGFEMDIAQPAATALSEHNGVAVAREVEKQLVGVGIVDHGAHGHAQRDVGCAGAVLIFATTLLTIARSMQASVAIVDQRVHVAVGHGHYAATPSAIAPVGTALGYELFAAEAGHAVAALAGDHFDRSFINELHYVSPS